MSAIDNTAIRCIHDDCRTPITWNGDIGAWEHDEECPPNSLCYEGTRGALPDPETSLTVDTAGVTVTITPSAGDDGAIVVFIDTTFEPDASDGGPGLRVRVNDDPVYEGKPYMPEPTCPCCGETGYDDPKNCMFCTDQGHTHSGEPCPTSS